MLEIVLQGISTAANTVSVPEREQASEKEVFAPQMCRRIRGTEQVDSNRDVMVAKSQTREHATLISRLMMPEGSSTADFPRPS